MSDPVQDLINEAVANKLTEIFRAHNNLVEAHRLLADELNKMGERVLELESQLRPEAPELEPEDL